MKRKVLFALAGLGVVAPTLTFAEYPYQPRGEHDKYAASRAPSIFLNDVRSHNRGFVEQMPDDIRVVDGTLVAIGGSKLYLSSGPVVPFDLHGRTFRSLPKVGSDVRVIYAQDGTRNVAWAVMEIPPITASK